MKYLFILSLLALAACETTTGSARNSATASGAAASESFVEIMQLMNAERATNGLPPLREDRRLSRASYDHARDMSINSYFSHVGLNGSDLSVRARAAGYNCVAAENIARGQKTEAIVMTAWINSPGHRRNINLSDTSEYGIGREGDVWVMLFGRGC